MNSSVSTPICPTSSAATSTQTNQQVPARTPDYLINSNAYYQRACFEEYLLNLAMQSQSERESQLSSIITRIKSGYRKLPNPKHILAMIRFNDQRKMHFKFWLRMNNQWPFTGSVEEMELWHDVDALSTQLYEMVYELDQEQMKLKQQVDVPGENRLNESNGGAKCGPSIAPNRNYLHDQNGNGSINEDASKTSRVYATGQQDEQMEQVNADVVADCNDEDKPTMHVSPLTPNSISMRLQSLRISPRIFSTAKSSKLSTCKSSIGPKPSSTSESAPKSNKMQTRSSNISTPPSPFQSSASSKSIIKGAPLYTKIGFKYHCHFGECTKVIRSLSHFKIHQRSHTGVKPFRCSVSDCAGYVSAHSHNVRRHIILKHYPKADRKDITFLNQFVETNNKLLNFIATEASSPQHKVRK